MTFGITNEENRSGSFPALTRSTPLVLDDLFRHDDKDHFVPMMATEVPTLKNGGIRNGGRLIVIHLKPGLHWSNGAEITAAHILFGWRVNEDPASDPVNNCGDLCTAVANVTTPDRYTAVIHLKRVDPEWLNETEGNGGLAIPSFWPGAWNNDPHAAALKYQDPSYIGHYPTNGPYVAESFNRFEAVLRPMPYYSGLTCGGFLRQIIFRVYNSSAALLAAASSRHVDVSFPPGPFLPPEFRAAARAGAYKLHVDPQFAFEHLQLNHDPLYGGQPNPLHDVRVRLALALAVDKISLIQSAIGLNRKSALRTVAWTPWINTPTLVQAYADTSITGQWDPIASRYTQDTGGSQALADARQLLAQTRWRGGFQLAFITSDLAARRKEAAAVAEDWAKIGVRLAAHFVPPGAFLADYDHGGIWARGAFQVTVLTAVPGDDPFGLSFNLESRYIPRDNPGHNGGNASGIRDPAIDRAFARIGSTFSHTIQRAGYAVIQTEIDRKAHWIPLYFQPSNWTEDGRVANLKWNASSGILWNPSAWKLRSP